MRSASAPSPQELDSAPLRGALESERGLLYLDHDYWSRADRLGVWGYTFIPSGLEHSRVSSS